ncbi:hypothetical protein VSS74_30305, partial [Conexibacter stalactiti]
MTSELDHLRAFRAAAAAPDDEARATARAALLDAIEAVADAVPADAASSTDAAAAAADTAPADAAPSTARP